MPFRYTINAYRGCTHACVYCFARPTHRYLDLDTGEDFERQIVVKVNAVERLRAELRAPRWTGEHIAMGTNTDPYQPAEGRYRLTRGLIEALSEARNPFSILTKSTMILRDLDLLVEAARRTARASASRSAPSTSAPGAPASRGRRRRVSASRRCAGWSSRHRVRRAGRAGAAGHLGRAASSSRRSSAPSSTPARVVSPILLHLRPGVRELFLPWLQRRAPRPRCRATTTLYASPSGYAPQAEQRAVARRVHRLVERHRGTIAAPGAARIPRAARPAREVARVPDFAQLSIGAAPGGGAAA